MWPGTVIALLIREKNFSFAQPRQEMMMNRLMQLLLLTILGLGIAGCNTTRGLGQDIEQAGDRIEDAADDAEDALDGDG